MKLEQLLSFMTDKDIENMHLSVLKILKEIGVLVESKPILEKLSEFGAEIDLKTQVARFPSKIVENYINSIERYDWTNHKTRIDSGVGVCYGKYLDPETNKYEEWTEKRLADYVKLSKALSNVSGIGILGCPIKDIPGEIHPVYSKYLHWKLGIPNVGYVINDIELCPYIEEFHHVRAEAIGLDFKKSIHGGVFLISPLKFPRTEAEQFLYFAERGYTCFIDHMISMGGSGTVTVPGTVAIHLAESIFTSIVQYLYYGTKTLYCECSMSPLDMKGAGFCYGRPEKTAANLMFGQMAVHYGAEYIGQTGLADAKTPGSEAASQKLLTAIPNLMYFKQAHYAAGMLSIDEVGSPIQMILDNEVVGALKRLVKPEPVNDDTIAFDTIKEAGHGGLFTDKMHTAENFREEIWDSKLWSSDLFNGWVIKGSKSAEDLALEMWKEIMEQPDPEPAMTPEAEKKVKDIIDRALKFKRRE